MEGSRITLFFLFLLHTNLILTIDSLNFNFKLKKDWLGVEWATAQDLVSLATGRDALSADILTRAQFTPSRRLSVVT
jgi:hypothetical protein